ncbi:hypothetical protein ACQP2C_05460 [Micromonospora zamorensis]|uniref:hypothetical protein n=1 Tax=Micromonospora zamorensis TaxID=709883 RepID=UPI003D969913
MTDTKAPTRTRVGPLLRRAAEAEAATWRSLYVWARRRPLPLEPGDEPFGYLGVVKPILGIFIGLSVVEIPIFDVVVTTSCRGGPPAGSCSASASGVCSG